MVNMEKKYRTRDGREVVIYCVDAPGGYPVHGRIEGVSLPQHWGIDGSRDPHTSRPNPLDLLEVSPYEDFKIDDPVMAGSGTGAWTRGYFAGMGRNGFPMTFSCGATSWTGSKSTTCWHQVRRPTEEELRGK